MNHRLLAYDVIFDPGGVLKTATNLGSNDPISITISIVNAVLGFLGLVSLILIIYAGFLWMTARGEEDQITKAKGILKGAVIGLLVILASYSLSYYIFTKLVSVT